MYNAIPHRYIFFISLILLSGQKRPIVINKVMTFKREHFTFRTHKHIFSLVTFAWVYRMKNIRPKRKHTSRITNEIKEQWLPNQANHTFLFANKMEPALANLFFKGKCVHLIHVYKYSHFILIITYTSP